jgi:hypothetical protein
MTRIWNNVKLFLFNLLVIMLSGLPVVYFLYRRLFCKIFKVRAFKIEIAKGHIAEVVSLAEQKERNHQKWLAEYAVNVEKNRRISPMNEEIFRTKRGYRNIY